MLENVRTAINALVVTGAKSYTVKTGEGTRIVYKNDLPWLYQWEDRLMSRIASATSGGGRTYASFRDPL
jgi:hypothetical protein